MDFSRASESYKCAETTKLVNVLKNNYKQNLIGKKDVHNCFGDGKF